jgi:ribosomal protein L37AE/L43A
MLTRSVEKRLSNLEARRNGRSSCPECGLGDGPVSYKVEWGDGEAEEEASNSTCPVCHRTTKYVITWMDE